MRSYQYPSGYSPCMPIDILIDSEVTLKDMRKIMYFLETQIGKTKRSSCAQRLEYPLNTFIIPLQ